MEVELSINMCHSSDRAGFNVIEMVMHDITAKTEFPFFFFKYLEKRNTIGSISTA